jgi:hypothetical protein
MQIANGIVVLHVHSQLPVSGATPAEVLILHAMHFKESNGSPLKDFFVQPGEAQTVEFEAKLAEPEYFHQGTGKTVPAVPAVPARTHQRTNREEIDRLKRKYTGVIEGKPVFNAVFGDAKIITLPETFAEISGDVGIEFPGQTEKIEPPDAAGLRRAELMAMKRHELVREALNLKLQVAPADSSEAIADGIIDAEKAQAKPETKAEKKAREKAEAGSATQE